MSQIETRRNLVSIDSISEIYSNTVNLSESILELFESAKVEFKNTSKASNLKLDNSSMKFVKNIPIESPISIATKFQQIYSTNVNGINCNNIEIRKNTIMQSIVEIPFYFSQPERIRENIVSLFNSDESNIKSTANNLIMEAKRQHCSVFANELQRIVVSASGEAGFNSINVKKNELNQVIVALDKEGKGIVSEIKIDIKSKQIDLISETVGVIDGNCNKIVKNFGNSLKKYGVKFSSVENRITGGRCQNAPTKKVDYTIKLNKEKETKLKQVRKIATNLKLKN